MDDAARGQLTLGGVSSLTRRLAAGDEAGFQEFHKEYFDRLYQFLLVVTRGNEQETRDALQETLLRVARYARSFESEDTFWCWLKSVARSAARDAGRKRLRYFALLENFALFWRSDASGRIASEENRMQALLAECLEELSVDDRKLVEGKYLDGAPVKELAVLAELTDKAVESRLLRLRRQLRARLLKKLQEP